MAIALDMGWCKFIVRHCTNDETVELVRPGALAAEIHDWSQELKFICRYRFVCRFGPNDSFQRYVEQSVPCRRSSQLGANGLGGNRVFPSMPPTDPLFIPTGFTFQDTETHYTCR